jgi:hypothetical protein
VPGRVYESIQSVALVPPKRKAELSELPAWYSRSIFSLVSAGLWHLAVSRATPRSGSRMAVPKSFYTGQCSGVMALVCGRVPTFFFSSETGLTVVVRPVAARPWRPLGVGALSSDTYGAIKSHRRAARIHPRRGIKTGSFWPVKSPCGKLRPVILRHSKPLRVTASLDPFAEHYSHSTHEARAALAPANSTAASTSAIAGIRYIA